MTGGGDVCVNECQCVCVCESGVCVESLCSLSLGRRRMCGTRGLLLVSQ